MFRERYTPDRYSWDFIGRQALLYDTLWYHWYHVVFMPFVEIQVASRIDLRDGSPSVLCCEGMSCCHRHCHRLWSWAMYNINNWNISYHIINDDNDYKQCIISQSFENMCFPWNFKTCNDNHWSICHFIIHDFSWQQQVLVDALARRCERLETRLDVPLDSNSCGKPNAIDNIKQLRSGSIWWFCWCNHNINP